MSAHIMDTEKRDGRSSSVTDNREDHPHEAALEDNPEQPEKLTWSVRLSILVRRLPCCFLPEAFQALLSSCTVPRTGFRGASLLWLRRACHDPCEHRHRPGRHFDDCLDTRRLVRGLISLIFHCGKAE